MFCFKFTNSIKYFTLICVNITSEPRSLVQYNSPVSGLAGQDTIQTRLDHMKSLCLVKPDTNFKMFYPVSNKQEYRSNICIINH